MRRPAISIVTATYNRARLLERCLRAVRHQTFQNWELLVIGDACTDDSAAVVASFAEPRFQWINLQRNCGEQSGPNNEGVARARGELIAFLNHDDFWFPDHLALALNRLESTGADLVFTQSAYFEPEGRIQLMGASQNGLYDWTTLAPATTWVARREMLITIGGWRLARNLLNVPSQDLLYRAHRAGFKLVQLPLITAAIVPSGPRKGSYLPTAGTGEHDEVLASLLRDPAAYREALTRTAAPEPLAVWRKWMNRAWFAAGVHPLSIAFLVRHGPRGGHLNMLRRNRGLSPLPQP